MKGEIKGIAHVSHTNGTEFFSELWAKLSNFDAKLYVEVQYSTTMQPDGRAVFSALMIGRERGDSDS